MALPVKLSDKEVLALGDEFADWTVVDGERLHREFRFADFASAFGFMSACAVIAAEFNHHPEWSNVYNRVVVELTTHDVGGLSELDLRFAARADTLAASFGLGG